ncbi:hypothetical protein EEL30_21595 [Brevibacillus laterosporus]|uniref:Uncharacterized protein n=1 Tax=Brevibacillus laterosporus TaxID=1465 RepID=A0A518VCE4_BRELA|nr:hypothetical protein EEL30_21595 [Brevibacillus laterosporus]
MIKEEINKKLFEILGLVEKDNGFWCYVERILDNEIVAEGYEGHFSFLTGDGMLLLIEEARKENIRFEITTHVELNLVLCGIDVVEHNSFTHVASHIHLPTAVALAYLKAKGVDITPNVEGVA